MRQRERGEIKCRDRNSACPKAAQRSNKLVPMALQGGILENIQLDCDLKRANPQLVFECLDRVRQVLMKEAGSLYFQIDGTHREEIC